MPATIRDSAYGGPWSKPLGDQDHRLSLAESSKICGSPFFVVAYLNLIIASSLSPQGSIVALWLVVFAIPVLVLIDLYAAVPHRASTMLGSLQTWMGNNNRAITVVICLVFGVFFLVRGLLGARKHGQSWERCNGGADQRQRALEAGECC